MGWHLHTFQRIALFALELVSFNILGPSRNHRAASVLHAGDVIFFSQRNLLDGSREMHQHVAIFDAFRNGKPFFSHAVWSGQKNYVSTTLPLLGDDTVYTVFRHKDPDIAKKAHKLISQWADLLVPYDERRYCLMEDMVSQFTNDEGHDVKAHYNYVKSLSKPNFYRRIKFASRRSFPQMPKDESFSSSGRGFRCDEAIAYAFQVAELENFIPDIVATEGIWVSDKYVNDNAIQALASQGHIPASFLGYVNALRRDNEFVSVQPHKIARENPSKRIYPPSLLVWDTARYGNVQEFIEKFESSLPFDAKAASPAVSTVHASCTHMPPQQSRCGH